VCRWRPLAQDTVGKQLIRAVDSIGANIAESYGRYHYGEKVNLLYYARGSLYESKFFVSRALKRGLVSEIDGEKMLEHLRELAPKLNAYIKSKKGQKKNAQPNIQ
jgi:four helix bundle protein